MDKEIKKIPKSATQTTYVKVRKWRKCSSWSLMAVALIILFLAAYQMLPKSCKVIPSMAIEYLERLQVLFILVYHFCLTCSSILHYQASKVHFPDFLDEALGSNLTTNHSKDYYSGEKIKKGVYKIAYQTAENCFFTKRIFHLMTQSQFFQLFVVALVVFLSFLGDNSNMFVFFCKLTIPIVWSKKIVVFFYAQHEFDRLYKEIYFVLTHKTSNSQLMADSINILLQYETLKAWLNFPASEMVYNSYRDLINEEFDKEQQTFVVY